MAGVPAGANNLALTNTTLLSPVAGQITVQFDLSWDNSWRDSTNYDACWVFVKYSTDKGSNWSHATLAVSGTNPPGFSNGVGADLDIIVPVDKTGAFIQRSAPGAGTVSNTGARLAWDFAADGVKKYQSVRVKVFAIEMVYVPEGPFWAGNTNGVIEDSFRVETDPNEPVYISSTNQFTIYWGTIPSANVISNAFPNGYAAFYLMKTEISQGQYCDFLNTLKVNQQNYRHNDGLNFNSSRNFIKKTGARPAVFGCDANNNAGLPTAVTNVSNLNQTNDGEWVACNYITWMDGAAYADWAALRPMTELEFEKACRGPLPPVDGEYAWGDTIMETATTGFSGTNTASETPNQGNCNYSGCSLRGPYRCGCYADISSTRAQAGAGYYGALDLSGSLIEWTVTVRASDFTGAHGDGALSANGYATVANWPGLSSGEIISYGNSGQIAGHCYTGTNYARIANRNMNWNVTIENRQGWRAVRTAP